MGHVNCCNRKDDDSGKMTMTYYSRERQIQDFNSFKARGQAGLMNNHDVIIVGNENDEEDLLKKLVIIQKRYMSYKNRALFLERKADLLHEHETKLKHIQDIFTSIFEKNLTHMNLSAFDSKHIYHNSEGNSRRIFKASIAKYETNEIFSFYKGEINIFGRKHGFGTLYYKDNSYYQGFWVEDSFSAFGRYIDSKGNLNEGKFNNWKLNGEGFKLNESGVKKGNFVEGMLQGFGLEETPDHVYEGYFVDDMKFGKGKYFFKLLNETYEGESKDNSITGYGMYIWNNNNVYEGTFLNGKMHGKGKYKWPDGAEYEGDYLDNIKQGNGRFKWSDGKYYIGEFLKGKPHGKGIIYYVDGSKYDITFQEGKPVSKNLINDT
jgi:hypothetical protein